MAAGNNSVQKMSKCKFTGLPLTANLYNDNRGRPDTYRYKSPEGRFKYIREPYDKAVVIAERANQLRDSSPHSVSSTRFWVDQYTPWMEQQNPVLVERRGWRDRKAALVKFAGEFPVMAGITIANLSPWWDGLTYDQQHSRRSNFSQFCQWAMSRGALQENPFNTSDALPHLIKKKKPAKKRMPIKNMAEFWAIYENADETTQIAAIISLTTTMREGDVVALTFDDNIANNRLCRTIAKSANQRGAAAATHLGWDLDTHVKLGQAIKRARELSMKHRRCPYIVSKRPQRLRERVGCTHTHQCTAKDLSRKFTQAVKAAGLWDNLPEGKTPPTFHEVRGLILDLLLKAGVDIRQVQKLAAHTDEAVTSAYTAQHEPDYVDLGIVVTDEVLGK